MNYTKTFWEKIYRENSSKIKGVCHRYVYNNQLAEDLMHEVFVTAITKSDTYVGKGSIEGWIRRIAINTALMHLRKKHTGIIFTDSEQINFAEMENTEIENTRRQIIESVDFSADELLGVIGSLPEHHRLVFNMYVIDRYSHAQISQELNISEGTSKSHLARARKKIQELLYHEAIDKQKHRKKGFILLLFFRPSKANYIDRLFQSKLSNYSIQVFLDFENLVQGVNMNNLIIPVVRSGITRITRYSSTVILIGLISIGIVSYKKPNVQLSPPSAADTILKNSIPAINNRLDYDSTKVLKNKTIESVDSNIDVKQVVVKRKIIQRKTVVIKDTIKISSKTKRYRIDYSKTRDYEYDTLIIQKEALNE